MQILSIIYFFLGTLLLNPLFCMEAPIQKEREKQIIELPSQFEFYINKERERFNKLFSDEKKFDKLQQNLQKKTNPKEYLKTLQRFANKLYWQHFLIQKLVTLDYATSRKDQFKELSQIMQKTLGITINDTCPLVHQLNDDELNEILALSDLINQKRPYTPENLKALLNIINNPHEITRTRILATCLLMENEIAALDVKELMRKLSAEVYPISREFLANKFCSPESNSILEENVTYLQKVITLFNDLDNKVKKMLEFRELEKIQPTSLLQISRAFLKEVHQIANIYPWTQAGYLHFYSMIYQELHATITDLLKKNPCDKTLMSYFTLYSPNCYQQATKILPARLVPLKPGSEFVTIIEPKAPVLFKKIIEESKEKEAERIKQIKEKRLLKKEKHRLSLQALSEKKETIKRVKEATDGSYIFEDDIAQKNITIQDPKNKSIITLFKTACTKQLNPKEFSAINYTEWNKIWFENPKTALEAQGYTDPKNKKFTLESRQWYPIAIHSFARLVDDYIFQWGVATKITSRRNPARQDDLITIPGMIEFHDGSEETGIFSYLIDSENGQWYHRMFEPQSGTKIINDLFQKGYFAPEMSGYYDVFFPALKKK